MKRKKKKGKKKAKRKSMNKINWIYSFAFTFNAFFPNDIIGDIEL